MKFQIQSLLLLVVLGTSFGSYGQNTDYQLWGGMSAQIKAGDKIRFGIEQQVRFNDAISSFKNTFSAASIKWKLTKRIAFRSTYRYTFVPNDSNQGRISADLIYAWSKKKFPLRIKNRFRYQRRSEFNSSKRTSFLRNKLLFEYNMSKLVDPFIAGEIFYRLDGRNEFRAWRVNTGLNWRLSKKLELKTSYQFEQEFNMKSNDRFHVIRIGLSWKVN